MIFYIKGVGIIKITNNQFLRIASVICASIGLLLLILDFHELFRTIIVFIGITGVFLYLLLIRNKKVEFLLFLIISITLAIVIPKTVLVFLSAVLIYLGVKLLIKNRYFIKHSLLIISLGIFLFFIIFDDIAKFVVKGIGLALIVYAIVLLFSKSKPIFNFYTNDNFFNKFHLNEREDDDIIEVKDEN